MGEEDKSERQFHEFTRQLLEAEAAGRSRDKDDSHTQDALAEILGKFCNIIAGHINVQSCTIQIKMYDPDVKEWRDFTDEKPTVDGGCFKAGRKDDETRQGHKTVVQGLLDQQKSTYDRAKKNALDSLKAPNKEQYLRGSSTFPYIIYPKGAARLVASNESGPWAVCNKWMITELASGITAKIVQDSHGRTRNRMSIRNARDQQKLGFHDPYVWINYPDESGFPLMFFNYYGVPIRTHQDGDVIGILKVENKGFGCLVEGRCELVPSERKIARSVKYAVNRILRLKIVNNDFSRIAGELSRYIEISRRILSRKCSVHSPSYVSIAYLAKDFEELTRHRTEEEKLGFYCCKSYFELSNAGLEDDGMRPPVQIFFEKIEDEDRFLMAMEACQIPEGGNRQAYEARLLAPAKRLIQEVNQWWGGKSNPPNSIRPIVDRTSIQLFFNEKLSFPGNPTVTLPREDGQKNIQIFTWEINVSHPHDNTELQHKLYLRLAPSLNELRALSTTPQLSKWRLDRDLLKQINRVNPGVTNESGQRDARYNYAVDRHAARIQALTYAFPSPAYSDSDVWKLSWAALQVGKLIERQIAYRGTSRHPIVPLTALDFKNVYIGDMTFVDAMRAQYKSATILQPAVNYHLHNFCNDLEPGDKLEITPARIKEFRSYLDRLGEYNCSHRQALFSTWFLVLNYLLENAPKQSDSETYVSSAEEAKKKAVKSFRDKLTRYCGNLKKTLSKTTEQKALWEVAENIGWAQIAGNDLKFYADLGFTAPPLCFEDKNENNEVLDKSWEAAKYIWANLQNSPQGILSPKLSDHLANISSRRKAKSLKEENQGIFRGVYDNPLAESMNKWLDDMIFRRYDPFAMMGISMFLLQAQYNPKNNIYWDFYRCFRAIKDNLQDEFAKGGIYDLELLTQLISQLTEIETKVFCESDPSVAEITKSETDEVFLNVRGVYKRLRALKSVCSNQVSPALLNWQLGRHDYIGARVNCLFKNQVFMFYEHLWNRGDPFMRWKRVTDDETNRFKWEQADYGKRQDLSRTRWLSIKTNVHKGDEGYYAWQITALMDPNAVNETFYASKWNLNPLRDLMTQSFDKWHKEEHTSYKWESTERNRWLSGSAHWFADRLNPILQNSKNIDFKPTKIEGAGDLKSHIFWPNYLCRAPLDACIHLLEVYLPKSSETTITKNITPFSCLIAKLSDFLEVMCESNSTGSWDWWSAASKVYGAFQREFAEVFENVGLDYQEELKFVRYEQDAWKEIFLNRDGLGNQQKIPFKLNDIRKISTFQDLYTRVNQVDELLKNVTELSPPIARMLLDTLNAYQSSQHDFLFKLGDSTNQGVPSFGDKKAPNIRSSRNVMSRMLWYVFTFDPAFNPDWSSYEIFYYLTSLVPVEIQIRTSLADTMAEQYHGIYKKSASIAEEGKAPTQQKNIQAKGRDLEYTDKQINNAYNDFAINQLYKRIFDQGKLN